MPLRTPLCIFAGLVLALSGAVGNPTQAGSSRITVLRGRLERNVTLKPTRTNVIHGIVVVASGTTLRLRPGTTVLAGSGSALVVERGAKLIAEGTPNSPSSSPVPSRKRNGIVVTGAALSSTAPRPSAIPDSRRNRRTEPAPSAVPTVPIQRRPSLGARRIRRIPDFRADRWASHCEASEAEPSSTGFRPSTVTATVLLSLAARST